MTHTSPEATCCAPAVAGAEHWPCASAAAVLNGNENAYLHLVHSSGSTLFEEGRASGALPGGMRAQLRLGSTFSGSFTVYTRYGDIRGRGSAQPHGSGRYQSFSGSVVIIGGTSRYTHAHGSGGFYGVFDRRTYNVTMQTRGRFYY